MSEPTIDAKNAPIRRPSQELHSADVRIDQKAPVRDARPEGDNVVVADQTDLKAAQLEALAFMEEPVTIRIEPSGEKNAAPCIDCWVNGRGAEVFIAGAWRVLGWLPVAVPVTTKRKYVEVLAKSKHDNVTTKVVKLPDSEVNEVERHTMSRAPFSVIRDDNPKGAEWLTRLLMRNF